MKEYSLASSTWDDKELGAINRVVSVDRYTMGEQVKIFEKDFASFVGSEYCVMVNSGSSANMLSIASLFFTKNPKLRRGDEVIVPAVSWSTTYSPLYQYGLKLKFVDIDLETLNYDLEMLEGAITEKTKMIIAVNLLGNPNNFQAINSIISGRDILLMEDNCESMGAEYSGKQTGTFGLLGTFSTFFSHHISTMEGGMIVTDDEEIFHILLSIRSHGWTRHLPANNKLCNKSNDPFKESFRFILPGYNVRPIEMSGAIGMEQLQKLPKFLMTRRENAETFKSLFQDHPDFQIQKEIGVSSWFGFSLLIKPKSRLRRSEVVATLAENKIASRPIVAGNFTKSESLRFFEYEIYGDLKNADYLDSHGLFVGNHHISIKEELSFLRGLF